MKRLLTGLIVSSALCLGHIGTAAADSGAEMYIDRAQDILHHSCASLVSEANGDTQQIESVVRLMVAVSLYNRDVDISEFAKTEDEKEALKGKFIDAVKKGCEADGDSLLAGIVDQAVVHALTTE